MSVPAPLCSLSHGSRYAGDPPQTQGPAHIAPHSAAHNGAAAAAGNRGDHRGIGDAPVRSRGHTATHYGPPRETDPDPGPRSGPDDDHRTSAAFCESDLESISDSESDSADEVEEEEPKFERLEIQFMPLSKRYCPQGTMAGNRRRAFVCELVYFSGMDAGSGGLLRHAWDVGGSYCLTHQIWLGPSESPVACGWVLLPHISDMVGS